MNIKLYNRNCIELLSELEANSVDLVLTDIPYNEVNRNSSGLRNLDKGSADIFDVNLEEFVDKLIRVCSGSFYIFCGTKQISQLVQFFELGGLTVRVGVWAKTNPSPMNGTRLWLSGLEYCVFARKPKATFNESCKKALWEAPSGRSKIHPTEKPIKLFERLILASTNEGDVVLDTCIGSGTSGVACVSNNRNFIGCELDKNYFDIAKKRIEESNKVLF